MKSTCFSPFSARWAPLVNSTTSKPGREDSNLGFTSRTLLPRRTPLDVFARPFIGGTGTAVVHAATEVPLPAPTVEFRSPHTGSRRKLVIPVDDGGAAHCLTTLLARQAKHRLTDAPLNGLVGFARRSLALRLRRRRLLSSSTPSAPADGHPSPAITASTFPGNPRRVFHQRHQPAPNPSEHLTSQVPSRPSPRGRATASHIRAVVLKRLQNLRAPGLTTAPRHAIHIERSDVPSWLVVEIRLPRGSLTCPRTAASGLGHAIIFCHSARQDLARRRGRRR